MMMFDVERMTDRPYCGKILNHNFSTALKQRVSECISHFCLFEKTGNPAIPYIAAWREGDNQIWYEYTSRKLLEFMGCSDQNLAETLRNAVVDRRIYRYPKIDREIQEEVLPEVDDAFAKKLSEEFETLEMLKDKIRGNLQNGYDKRVEQELQEQVYQQLLAKTEFEVPDTMVESELEHIIKEAEQSFSYNNRTLEDVGLSREKLAENYRPTAEKQVRRHLILSKIIEQENLTLSDEALDQGFQEMADTYRQPVDQIKAYYNQNKNGLEFFKHTLLEKQALKIIIDNSVVKEVEPVEPAEHGEPAESEPGEAEK